MLKWSLVLRHRKKTSTRYPVYWDISIPPGRKFVWFYHIWRLKMYQQNYQGAIKKWWRQNRHFQTPSPLVTVQTIEFTNLNNRCHRFWTLFGHPPPPPALVTSFLSGPFIQMRNYRWQYHIICYLGRSFRDTTSTVFLMLIHTLQGPDQYWRRNGAGESYSKQNFYASLFDTALKKSDWTRAGIILWPRHPAPKTFSSDPDWFFHPRFPIDINRTLLKTCMQRV